LKGRGISRGLFHSSPEHDASHQPTPRKREHGIGQDDTLGEAKTQEGSMTVWIYVDTDKEVGHVDHLKVFASREAAETWLAENDPEGEAFEYEVRE
jgi:hypothetical protein